MKAVYITEAIEICRKHHSTALILNYVRENDIVSNAVPIVLTKASAATVQELQNAGFSLFLEEGGLHVEKF